MNGRVAYVTDDQGVVLLASDRAALLEAAPQHEAQIRRALPDATAHQPAWLLCLDAEGDAAVGQHPITCEPRWWLALYFYFETPQPSPRRIGGTHA